MLYLIDTADPKSAAELLETYPIAGVTTNPTIVSREKCDFAEMLRSMRAVIGPDRMLHVQTLQTEAGEMVREARALKAFVGGDFYIKLPITPEGLRAAAQCKREGISVTITAIFSAQQALVAARAGVDFVAPYVNKMDDVTDGCHVVTRIAALLKEFSLPTRVLSASFRNVEQITHVAASGSHAATLPPPFFEKLIWSPMTDLALEGFHRDWDGVYEGKRPIDLI